MISVTSVARTLERRAAVSVVSLGELHAGVLLARDEETRALRYAREPVSELEHVDERCRDLCHLVACELPRLRSVLLVELDVGELVDVARDHEPSAHGHLPA